MELKLDRLKGAAGRNEYSQEAGAEADSPGGGSGGVVAELAGTEVPKLESGRSREIEFGSGG